LYNSLQRIWTRFVFGSCRIIRIKAKIHNLNIIPLIFAVTVLCAVLVIDWVEDTVIEGKGILPQQLTNLFFSVSQGVTATIYASGYLGILLLMFLEGSSFPIPSEVILPFSGYLVSLGRFDPLLTVLVSTIGGVAGSLLDYFIGLFLGTSFVKRFGRYVLIDEKRLTKLEQWFHAYGWKVVLLSRLIPGVRTLISFPAGIGKMSIPKFLACTTLGCFTWNFILIYMGFYLGKHWQQIIETSNYLSIIVIAASLIIIGFLIWKKSEARKH
jgi:membrane protein DedA with SNARE-associated domain